MSLHEDVLKNTKKKWLITGVSGFIGSNILDFLLKQDQEVVGIDNFSTSSKDNINNVINLNPDKANLFSFIEGDITNGEICKKVTSGVNYVLHQAALGSVPRSVKNPIATNHSNVSGFLNILNAAKDEDVDGFVYASSSSVYGDQHLDKKQEDLVGNALSPYALSKKINEQYAEIFNRTYNFRSVGLRYFNVFGPRQSPLGEYSAVIPKWVGSMINNEDININGDGTTSRDFCFVKNVVQANILSALQCKDLGNECFNVACGDTTTLLQLFKIIKDNLLLKGIEYNKQPIFKEFRVGDVKNSQANLSKIQSKINYFPEYKIHEGMKLTIDYYIKFYENKI